MAETTKVMRCERNCAHEYQDARYGKGNRLHTLTARHQTNEKAIQGERRAKCTVCGNVIKIG
jgi:hypothetical protein